MKNEYDSSKSAALFFGRETSKPAPVAARKERGAYDSGERAKDALAKCFPDGMPSEAEVPNGELVRRVQMKHDELYRSATAPSRKTILIHAGRKNPN
jgi:hypothetical protein